MEDGEDLRSALVREVREELSATIAVGDEIANDGMAWPISETYELRLLAASMVTGELVPGPDHDAVLWLGPDQLESVEWLPADRQALAAIRALLVSSASESVGKDEAAADHQTGGAQWSTNDYRRIVKARGVASLFKGGVAWSGSASGPGHRARADDPRAAG